MLHSLSGLSPFAGESDPETLANVTAAELDFDAEEFSDVTTNAKDFIEKLIIKRPKYVSLIICPVRAPGAVVFC